MNANWYALWTKSHCEQRVCAQLEGKGFHPFLPTMASWSTRDGRQHRIGLPLFPGYLFLHDAIDRYAYVEVQKTRGLVSFLGRQWNKLALIPDAQIDSIRRLVEARVPMFPHPYLRQAERVRVLRGPLEGMEGTLVEIDPHKGRLVVSVDLLQRSVAVEINCADAARA